MHKQNGKSIMTGERKVEKKDTKHDWFVISYIRNCIKQQTKKGF